MTHSDVNQIFYILGVFCVWGVGLFLLHKVDLKTYWNKNWRGSMKTLATIRICWAMWYLFPLVSLVTRNNQGLSHLFLKPRYLFAVVILTGTCALWFHHWHTRTVLRLYAVAVDPKRRKWRGSMELWYLLFLVLFLNPMGISAGWRWLLILGLFAHLHVRSSTGKANPLAGTFETVELPLHYEISQIAEALGRSVTQLLFTNRLMISGSRLQLGVRDSSSDDRFPVLVVSCQALRELNPYAVTAGLAVEWARTRRAKWITEAGRTITGKLAAGCAVGILGLTVVMSWVWITAAFLKVFDSPSALGLWFTGSVLALIISICWVIYRRYMTSFIKAWEAWEDVQGEEERHPQDFINAIAEQYAYTCRINDPKLVVHQLFLNRAFLNWLNLSGIVQREAKAGLLQHLHEMR